MQSSTAPRSWPAYYYDGQQSARHRVTIRLAPSGMIIQKEGGDTVFWPYAEITQASDQYTKKHVCFERGAFIPETIVIEDRTFLSSFQAIVTSNYCHFHFPVPLSRRIGLLAVAMLLSIAAIVAVILWGIPAIANALTPFVPSSWEVALGKTVVAQLAPPTQQCTNQRLRHETQTILRRLLSPSHSSYDFHLTIVNGKAFNAFALPGGEIVVVRPLLQATQIPTELAGVLAHGAQHILLRHTTNALLRDMSLAMLIGALFGDISGVSAFAVQAARTFSTLHYNREMEEEADEEGLRLLQRANINPYGMIRFFETMKDREEHMEIPAYLSTHPATEDRIIKLRSLLKDRIPSQEIIGEGDWNETKNLCR